MILSPQGALSDSQLTGLDDSFLVSLSCGHWMQLEAAAAFDKLREAARVAGFELAIGSSYRSFHRQLTLWNGKASGLRPVHDDNGEPVAMASLSARQKLEAILRYSALPGASRHHWGTDVDVYDAAAVPANYQLQLSPAEVCAGGVFDAMHCWLDERIITGHSEGFFRPYSTDRGGVAPERWHLSYAPVALTCAQQFGSKILRACWNQCVGGDELMLRQEIEADLPDIFRRFLAVDTNEGR